MERKFDYLVLMLLKRIKSVKKIGYLWVFLLSIKITIVEKSQQIGYDVAEEILDQAGKDFIIKESKLAHTIYKRGNW